MEYGLGLTHGPIAQWFVVVESETDLGPVQPQLNLAVGRTAADTQWRPNLATLRHAQVYPKHNFQITISMGPNTSRLQCSANLGCLRRGCSSLIMEAACYRFLRREGVGLITRLYNAQKET